jgi:hypothetical protein
MTLNDQIMKQLENKTLVQAHNYLLGQGVKSADIGLYLGEYLVAATGKGQRTFNYSTDFPAEDAACIVGFEPQFQHQDWVDGEDVVQAGETPTEAGFNRRFHSIEGDFAAIQQDLARGFQCLAEMRAGLQALLEEVRLELNRLNRDVADLQDKGTKPTFPVSPDILTDPGRKLLGVSQFANKDYLVYGVGDKYEMLPLVKDVALPPSNILQDPRIANPSMMGKLIEDTPELKGLFNEQGGVSPDDIKNHFGDVVLENGLTVNDALRILPPGEKYTSPELMLDRMADLNAAAIRATESPDTILNGLGAGTSDIGTVSLQHISNDAELTNSLSGIGISTVEDLQGANIADISAHLAATGANVSSGELQKIVTTGNILAKLR